MSQNNDPDLIYRDLISMEESIRSKAQPMSLNDAIIFGIQNNPQLKQSFFVIQQYEWDFIAAQRQWFPTLAMSNGSPFIGYTWSTFVQNQYGLNNRSKSDSSSISNRIPISSSSLSQQTYKSKESNFQPGLTFSWNFIDLSRQPDINSASEALNQQKLLFNVSARTLIASIQSSYFKLQQNHQLISSFKDFYQINKRQLETLEAQQSIGMSTILDTEQTRSQIFNQLNQLVSYVQDFIEASSSLSKLLALPDESFIVPSESVSISGSWMMSLEETLKLAVEQREEIQASLAAARSAKWSGISLMRSYLPVVQLTANGSLDFTNGYSHVPIDESPGTALTENKTWTGSAGIGFTWSIFDGGISAANAQSSYAQYRQNIADAENQRLSVVNQVESSFASMETSKASISSAKSAYSSANNAHTAARARLVAGVGDITSVVQSMQLLSTAAQQVASAIYSYNTSISNLYRYTATWPYDIYPLIDRRLNSLRNRSTSTK